MIYRNATAATAARAGALACVCAVLALSVAGCGAATDPDAQAQPQANAHASAEPPSIAAALRRLTEFSRLSGALRAHGLMPTLAQRGSYTLLAPRDAAFAKLGVEGRAALFAPQNGPALAAALRNLVIRGAVSERELRERITTGGGSAQLTTLSGGTVTVTLDGEMLVMTTAGGARATMGTAALSTENGTIYIIDSWPG